MTTPDNSVGWLVIVSQLGVPALVAAIVTFILNGRLESRRGKRDLNSRAFEAARGSVAKFSEQTSLYWSKKHSNSDTENETRIMLAESDLRNNVSEAIELVAAPNQEPLQTALDDLLRFGTGGQFQSSGRPADVGRVRLIAGAASQLHGHLLKQRRTLMDSCGH